MGSDGGGRGRHCTGVENMGTNAWDTFSLVFRRVQGYTVQGVAEMVYAGGSETGIFTSLSSFIHQIVERFNQTLLNRLRRMWAEEPKYFAKTVERAVAIYNDTPLSSPEESKETPNSFVFGSPNQLWGSSRTVWRRLCEHTRRQRAKENY